MLLVVSVGLIFRVGPVTLHLVQFLFLACKQVLITEGKCLDCYTVAIDTVGLYSRP